MGVAWELERADCLLVQRKEVGEPTVEVKDSRRWEEAHASQTSLFAKKRVTKKEERGTKVSGEDRENRTNPRRAFGSLSGSLYRGLGASSSWSGRWGTDVPRDPL